jgi:hypothetical protein
MAAGMSRRVCPARHSPQLMTTPDKQVHIIMDFYDKGLPDLLRSSPNGLSCGEVRLLAVQVLRALEFMHERQVRSSPRNWGSRLRA